MTYSSGRYPYTYAYDYLREKTTPNISRADMSQILGLIVDGLGLENQGMTKETCAIMLAEKYFELWPDERPNI